MHLCNWSQKNFQRERLGESEWERKELAAVNLQQQQPYHLRGKMTLKSTSVYWRACNPSCNHCYNVGLATASRELRIAFNLWGFFLFLLSALFSFYVEEWRKIKNKKSTFMYPPKIVLGSNLVWSQESSVSGTFLQFLLEHMLLRVSCGPGRGSRGTVPPSVTRSSHLQPKAYWV